MRAADRQSARGHATLPENFVRDTSLLAKRPKDLPP